MFKVCLCEVFILTKHCVCRNFSCFILFINHVHLIAGTIFVMWLGEQIQERGLGNGTSIIIMANIILKIPGSFWAEAKA
jgi:preprotein translocase subunit SecY